MSIEKDQCKRRKERKKTLVQGKHASKFVVTIEGEKEVHFNNAESLKEKRRKNGTLQTHTHGGCMKD